MLLSEVRLGRPLEIYITREGYHYRIVSKIEYAEEGCVCVTLIANGKRVFQFLETDEVDIVYQEQDRMWKWSDVKGAVVSVEDERMHGFFAEGPGENYNRRNAFRLYFGKDLKIRYLVRDQQQLKSMQEKEALSSQIVYNYDSTKDGLLEECYRYVECKAFLRDISEVGVGLYANERFLPEDTIEFSIYSEFGPIDCKAVVVRMREHVNGSFKNYYGCRFIETSRNLTKYLYEQQRIQLQNANSEIKRK